MMKRRGPADFHDSNLSIVPAQPVLRSLPSA
jgi:hypothetical protein